MKDNNKPAQERGVFQVVRRVNTKVLRWRRAWNVQEDQRRSLWLKCGEIESVTC